MSTFSSITSRLADGDLHFQRKADGATILALGVAGLGLGAAEAVTIAAGVATVTKSFVRLTSESSTADTVDAISKAGAADGDLLLLVPAAGHTITVENATINTGAAARVLAPGGSLLLYFDGDDGEWTELFFTAATDNSDV